MRVKPQDGMVVRNPIDGSRLPGSGKNVPNNSYWRRRLAAGDVVPVSAEAPSQKAPAEEKAPTARSSRRNADK